MRHIDLYEQENVRTAYHGSPQKFSGFNTTDVFLANDSAEARRYGNYLYRVSFVGKPKFETPTIMVIRPEQAVDIEVVDHNPDQVIYRT